MKNITTLAIALFRFLDEEGIAYCVVGDSRSFPQHIHSDIDIVAEQSAIPTLAEKIYKFSFLFDIKLIQCLQHEHNAQYFVMSWADTDGKPLFLIPDVCGNYFRRGKLFLKANELLTGRIPATDEDGQPKGFFVPSPPMEFIYYLLKRIDKESIDNYQGSHLSAQWALDPVGAKLQLKRFWSEEAVINLLATAAEKNNWSTIQKSIKSFRDLMNIHQQMSWSPKAWLSEMHRKIKRVFQPSGFIVAFVGPDGSGKSSVISACEPLIAPAFRRTATMHLRPRIGAIGSSSGAVTDPHAKAPRGKAASLAKIFYFAMDYAVGYWIKIRPLIMRSTCIIFDRYYHDILADPRRYRYGGPMWVARMVRHILPGPDLWVVMDAPAQVLQSRKQEVTFEETARQREAYLKFVEDENNVVVLDASRPLDTVVPQGANAILDKLAARTKRRLGILGKAKNPIGAKVLLFFSRHQIPMISRFVGIIFNSDIYADIAPSVKMPHPYGIIIHSKAVIGERVTIMQQVTIGGKDVGRNVAPKIGDEVYIGTGAKVLGDIHIGKGAIIGANAVITKDVPAHATVVGANRMLETSISTASDFIDVEVASFIPHTSLELETNAPIRTFIQRQENVVHEVPAG